AADSVFYQFYLARPDMACFALKQILLESVDPLPGFDTLTVSGGRLNLRNALLAMADFEPPDTVLRGVHIVSPNGGEEWYSGNWVEVQWSSFGLSENVKIELNRDYPNGLWEVIFPDIQNYGIEAFLIEGETTTHVRLRVSSLLTPALSDVSDGDIHLVSPILDIVHNSLGDFEPGAGTVTCWASDSSPLLSVAGVYMFFRATGGTDFDSLDLLATGNPSEYSADLSSFAAGNYEYYVQMRDNADRPVRDPVGAPVNFHTFTVGDLCEAAIAYDDGTAEFYGWSDGGTLNDFEWAVKFTPVGVPYVLCGASVAVSHGLPDTMHSPIQVRVYDANGAGGQPGTLLWQGSHGSIGNEIGGLSAGIHWADVVIRDGGGEKLMLSVPEFYISVSNLGFGKYEAFGRDANGPNAHRSYFYDPCEVEWFSEDDTTASDNAYPGNRMIRALGYAVAPPDLVAARDGDEIKLHWSSTGAPLYNVYSSALPEGPFGFLESTTDTILTVAAVDTTGEKLFYRVQSATE
ncbi:hypothetical protein KJ815_02875, partial [bacterium]|nr:hypothetical protein [bacterium]